MSESYHAMQLSLFPTKVCPRCTKELSIDDFSLNRNKSDGRAYWCKRCHGIYKVARRKDINIENYQVTPRERKKQRIIGMLQAGFSYNQIEKEIGCTKSAISYHAKCIGLSSSSYTITPFNWEEIQRYYDEGNSILDCMHHFGITKLRWRKALKKGWLKAKPLKEALNPEKLFIENSPYYTGTAKHHLFTLGLRENKCEACGITDWNGKPLGLELHHINGVNTDHRLENLQLLCPNCHTQTQNYGARNKQSARPRKPRKQINPDGVA